MSAEATGWVYRHSPFKGAAFTVHQAIGDSVNDQNDNEFWMAQGNLKDKTRLSERAVRQAVAALVEGGFIEPCDPAMADPIERQKAGRPTRWRFLFPDVAVVYETRKRPQRSTPMVGSDGHSVGWDTPAEPAGVGAEAGADAAAPGADGSAGDADVTQENPTSKPKSAPRARFEEFDALEAAFGPVSGSSGTREEAAFYAKVARSLKAQGKTPAEIEDRGKRARARHPDCTPNVLLTRWSSFAPTQTRRAGGSFDDVARRDAEARR